MDQEALRALTESYLLELIGRARMARNRCEALVAEDFTSHTPRAFASTLSRIAEYLERAGRAVFAQIDWEDTGAIEKDLRILSTIDFQIQQVAAHLRYVQGARSERLPWNIIPAFERFVAKLLPGRQFLLCAKWNYNYSVTTVDFRNEYLRALQEIEDFLPDEKLEDSVFAELKTPLQIVAFPSLERENILLHTLLGHELGHQFVSQILTTERRQRLTQEVLYAVEQLTEAELSRSGHGPDQFGTLFWPKYREQTVQANLSLVVRCWRRALEELLADAVGAILFGPAALFSTLEMAMQEGLDSLPTPSNNFYPPWRMRLREVAVTLGRLQETLLEGIEHLLAIPELRASGELFKAPGFVAELKALIERLDHKLPPSAFEEGLDDQRPADLVTIINAAWFHRVSLKRAADESHDDALKGRQRANRLTLKAIEYASLLADYREAEKGRLQRFHHQDDDPQSQPAERFRETLSVLSKAEIAEAMEKGRLRDRLVITPCLDPAESISSGSIDVRLGCEFLVFRREAFPALDIGQEREVQVDLERYQSRRIKAYGEPFVLHPRQLVIGSTLEYVQVPSDLMCYVVGKSTWGRMGLIIATATKVDPGFRGCITLEILNEGEVPLVLYPGLPIAQLVVHRASGSGRYEGGFQCSIGPEFPKFGTKLASWRFWTHPRKDSKDAAE